MTRIVRVGALDDDKLDIEFDNGHIVLLGLASKMRDPAFAALLEDGRICCPKTDGRRVYWTDGPSLTVDEIMGLLREGQTEKPGMEGGVAAGKKDGNYCRQEIRSE